MDILGCFLLLVLVRSIRFFQFIQNTGILGNQIAEHIRKSSPFVNSSDVCDKDHLRGFVLKKQAVNRNGFFWPQSFLVSVLRSSYLRKTLHCCVHTYMCTLSSHVQRIHYAAILIRFLENQS